MALEVGNYIPELVPANPENDDDVGEGDDHLRLIKLAVTQSFPGFVGTTADPKFVTLTEDQINDAALKSAANVFTESQELRAVEPLYQFNETDASVDEARWYLRAINGSLRFQTVNDAESVARTFLWALRDGGVSTETALLVGADVYGVRALNGAGVISYYNGAKRFETALNGQSYIYRNGNTDTENNAFLFAYNNGTVRGLAGYAGDSTLTYQNQVHGALVSLTGEDVGGVLRTIFSGDPDGSSELYNQGNLVAATNFGGMDLYDPSGSNPFIGFRYGSSRAGFIQVGTNGFVIRSEENGLNMSLQAEDAAGVNRNLIVADPDGDTTIYESGQDRLVARSTGLLIRRDVNNDVSDSRVRFQWDNQTDRGSIGFLSNEVLAVRNQVHGANLQLQGEDAGGLLRTFFTGDPDADSSMFYKGTQEFRTANHLDLAKSTGAEVKHRDGSFYGVGMSAMPPADISTALTIGATHSQKCVRWTGGAAGLDVTLPDDSDIPVNEWGMIANKSTSDKDVVAGAGVTIYRYDGVGTSGNVTLAPGERLFWWKISDTLYEVW